MNVLVDVLWGLLSFAFFVTLVACGTIGGVQLMAAAAEGGTLIDAAKGGVLLALALLLAWAVYDLPRSQKENLRGGNGI